MTTHYTDATAAATEYLDHQGIMPEAVFLPLADRYANAAQAHNEQHPDELIPEHIFEGVDRLIRIRREHAAAEAVLRFARETDQHIAEQLRAIHELEPEVAQVLAPEAAARLEAYSIVDEESDLAEARSIIRDSMIPVDPEGMARAAAFLDRGKR